MDDQEKMVRVATLRSRAKAMAKARTITGEARMLLNAYHGLVCMLAGLDRDAIDEVMRPKKTMAELQRRAAYEAYLIHGTIASAARSLNISRSTFYRRYRRFIPKG